MRILVCDGDAASRAIIRRLITMAHGHDIVECATGAEALDLLGQRGFDLLLLETDLPVLTGFETLSLVRETPELRTLPVILVTNDRTEESVQRAIALGVTDYILKPLRVQRLNSGLRAVLAGAAESRHAGAPARIALQPQTSVLLADGDTDFREFFCGLLSPYCAVVGAPSGAAALGEAWRTAPSVAFIGRGLGVVSTEALIRHLGRMGVEHFVRIVAPDEEAEPVPGFDDTVQRTLVAGAMLRQLKRFIARAGGPLHTLLEDVPDLRSILLKTTASTFGMMLGVEVDVVEATDADIVDAYALVSMQVGQNIAVTVELQCASELVRRLAANTLGDDVDAQTAVSVLGEIDNVITGRLQASVVERGLRCLCSVPSFGVGQRPAQARPDDEDRLTLEFELAGSSARFRILVLVRHAGAERVLPELPVERTA